MQNCYHYNCPSLKTFHTYIKFRNHRVRQLYPFLHKPPLPTFPGPNHLSLPNQVDTKIYNACARTRTQKTLKQTSNFQNRMVRIITLKVMIQENLQEHSSTEIVKSHITELAFQFYLKNQVSLKTYTIH